MANLKDKLVQQNKAVVVNDVNGNFKLMAAALQDAKATIINIEQSYLSKYDVADELRLAVKDKTTKPPAEIKVLLDPAKTMKDIVNNNSYTKLESYLNSLDRNEFEPPLKPDYQSPTGVSVKTFLNKINDDPRRTGRLIKPGPVDVLKSTEIQRWMINNSILYGFVLYDDNALYYVGVDRIKTDIKNASDKQTTLNNFVSGFLRSANSLALLTTKPAQVINNTLPPINSDPAGLELIPNTTVKDNKGNTPELIVIDGQPVVKATGIAYLAMKQQAASEGVTLKISSGFRPAFGANFSGLTSKGRNITFTTQETLRRDKSRWITSQRAKYTSDDQYVFDAPASAFNPATAAPGLSQHGSGIAIDMNTGGRTNFTPLNSPNYVWLVKNSYKFGFIRTVGTEEWHYEYLPDAAKQGPYAKVAGTNGNKFYNDLGLASGQFAV